MAESLWKWLFSSDAGLLLRIATGLLIFASLAVWDIGRKGRQAQRWREYSFLLVAVAAALAYGAINDQITVTVSWEYFYYGKGLGESLGLSLPANMAALRWEAAKVGLKATWTAGLILGVTVLLANNPRRGLERLRYRELYSLIPLIFVSAAVGGIVLGLAGYSGAFANWFAEIVGGELWRPERFMAVWGAHLGGYVGGALGAAASLWWILRQRRKLVTSMPSQRETR